jgi:hypothetical protein
MHRKETHIIILETYGKVSKESRMRRIYNWLKKALTPKKEVYHEKLTYRDDPNVLYNKRYF